MYPTTITPGKDLPPERHRPRPKHQVSLNDTEVINTTDTTYATGLLGVNGFQSTAQFRNLHLATAP